MTASGTVMQYAAMMKTEITATDASWDSCAASVSRTQGPFRDARPECGSIEPVLLHGAQRELSLFFMSWPDVSVDGGPLKHLDIRFSGHHGEASFWECEHQIRSGYYSVPSRTLRHENIYWIVLLPLWGQGSSAQPYEDTYTLAYFKQRPSDVCASHT